MTNRVDPDQTLLEEPSDFGLHCLLRPICPNTLHYYGTCSSDTFPRRAA